MSNKKKAKKKRRQESRSGNRRKTATASSAAPENPASVVDLHGPAVDATPREVPDFYYDGTRYYYRDATGVFHSMDEKSLRRWLIEKGFYVQEEKRKNVDPYIIMIQAQHAIRYAGPLAGYRAGIHELQPGRKILVTETTEVLKPAKRAWPTLKGIFTRMFSFGDFDQLPYFYGWLQVFLKSYRNCLENGARANLIPGQALALAGPRDSGKTLLKLLFKYLFGGRTAHPHQFMSGQTAFNAEFAESALLEIDDQAASKDPRDRNVFGARIKEFTVAGSLRVHPKYQRPVDLRPCQRLMICVNDEPSALMVLPPVEESIADKLMLLKVSKSAMPMSTDTEKSRNRFWQTLINELPGFVYFLLHEFEIPRDLKSGRFGVTHFHHPDLLDALKDLAPETRVLQMIDELFGRGTFFTGDPEDHLGNVGLGENLPRTQPWIGPSHQFESIIRGRFARWATDRLFRYDNSAGMLLQTLSTRYPNRVKKGSVVRGQTRWIIYPDPEAVNDPDVALAGVARASASGRVAFADRA